MKQWQIIDDWSFAGLKLTEADVPEPGPGELLLRMKAVSLNYRDYLMVNHGYGRMSGELPLVPLSDGVGEVMTLGADVDDIAIGSIRAGSTVIWRTICGPSWSVVRSMGQRENTCASKPPPRFRFRIT